MAKPYNNEILIKLAKALQAGAGSEANIVPVEGVTIPQLGQMAFSAAKNHPFKTAGAIGSAAGNLGGLTDNDKFGGQLGGLALGGLGSYLAGDALGPYGKLMLTMGGGNLGALFDKLRAKKEQEQQAQSYIPYQ